MNSIIVTLYTRENCMLCQEAYYLLMWLSEKYPITLEEIEISKNPELELRYALEVPVVEINGQVVAMSFIEEGVIREHLDTLLSVR